MKLIIDGKDLIIKDEYFKHIMSDDFKMKNETSYLEKFIIKYRKDKKYRTTNLPLKIQCLVNIKKYIDNYDSYLDCLAGLGMSGKIFISNKSYFNDFDDSCVSILKDNFDSSLIYKEDIFKFDMSKTYDFIFSDFNNFTLKRYFELYKPVVDNMFKNSNKYILINDCSKFYLRYGKTSYKVYNKFFENEINSLNDYYAELKKLFNKIYPLWSLTNVEYFQETGFLLFKKENNNSIYVHSNDCSNLNKNILIFEE